MGTGYISVSKDYSNPTHIAWQSTVSSPWCSVDSQGNLQFSEDIEMWTNWFGTTWNEDMPIYFMGEFFGSGYSTEEGQLNLTYRIYPFIGGNLWNTFGFSLEPLDFGNYSYYTSFHFTTIFRYPLAFNTSSLPSELYINTAGDPAIHTSSWGLRLILLPFTNS